MTSVFANNAYSTLATSVTTSATAIVLSAGEGARFPAPTGSDYFYVTFIDTANNLEIAKCTSRATDTLTVVRAQEGTTATAYAVGDRVEQRVTAAGLTDVITAAEAAASDAVTGTSVTSVAIATGAKSFTTQTGKFFAVGQWLLATSDANGANYMHGQSTAYDTATGALTINVVDIGGSGTFIDWTIRLSGTRGDVGAVGPTGQPQWQGQWLTATNYVVNDSVYENGSSYICLNSHTSGTFAIDLGNSDWELMAEKGTGDVNGPAASTDTAIVRFSGTSGKAIQNSGITIDASDNLKLAGALDPNGNLIGRVKGVDIVSASPLVIGTDGDYFDVTGTVGFSAMTVAANRSFVLRFTGVLTITVGAGITLNNAAANFTTSAGDTIVCQSTATDTVIGYIIKEDGTAVVGPSASVLTKYFQSADQTLTAAGLLTIAHGLGTKPTLEQHYVKNLTAEYGYSIGEVTAVITQVDSLRGATVVADATNINIRFSSDANVFSVINYTSGAIQAITLANWSYFIRVWA